MRGSVGLFEPVVKWLIKPVEKSAVRGTGRDLEPALVKDAERLGGRVTPGDVKPAGRPDPRGGPLCKDPEVAAHWDTTTQAQFDKEFPEIKGINPMNMRGKGEWGYTHNCQSCTVATDHVLGGGDPVTAVREWKELRHDWPDDTIKALGLNTTARRMDTWDDVIKEMQEAGPGSRGIIEGVRTDPNTGAAISAHVFNVVHKYGRVNFVDGQINEFADLLDYSQIYLLRTN